MAARIFPVTDAVDGDFVNRMYPYWSNACLIDGQAYIFAGTTDDRPKFFRVNLDNGEVTRLGALLPYTGTGEGWSWDINGRIYLGDGPFLRRVNPISGQDDVIFSVQDRFPGHRLWQIHVSRDGQMQSATLQRVTSEGAYPNVGTVVHHSATGQLDYFPALGKLDESSISKNGRWVLIQEDNNDRIIDLTMDPVQERLVYDAERAVAHCDMGPDYAIGEADKPDPGACVKMDLATLEITILYLTNNMGHVSVQNGKCLLTDVMNLSLLPMDGSGPITLAQHGMVVPPNATPDVAYNHQCMANLDPTATVAVYVTNRGGRGRFDVDLLVLPQ